MTARLYHEEDKKKILASTMEVLDPTTATIDQRTRKQKLFYNKILACRKLFYKENTSFQQGSLVKKDIGIQDINSIRGSKMDNPTLSNSK